MRAFIEQHNATLPKQTDAETLRAVIEKHNATLRRMRWAATLTKSASSTCCCRRNFRASQRTQNHRHGDESLHQRVQRHLPAPLKTTGGRDALLEQLATIDPGLSRRARDSGAVAGQRQQRGYGRAYQNDFANCGIRRRSDQRTENGNDQRQPITQAQMKHAKAIQRSLFTHPSVGQLLQNPQRAVEVSYFGIDEETGLELRVRPDLEIEAVGLRIGYDLKTVSMGNVKQAPCAPACTVKSSSAITT